MNALNYEENTKVVDGRCAKLLTASSNTSTIAQPISERLAFSGAHKTMPLLSYETHIKRKRKELETVSFKGTP